MPRCPIDHITVTSPTLARGAEFILQSLGVEMQAGGEHPRMGTHNLLLRLGESMFLEVIAPNPAAPPPSRPRWFAMDGLHAGSEPALSTWVLRSADIAATHESASEALGPIEPMSRGALNWLLTIPEDGSIPLDGVAPALIQWKTDSPPATKLPERGLALAKLEIFHADPARVSRLLASVGCDGPVTVTASASAPRLVAHIQTAQGLRALSAFGDRVES